MISDTYKTIKSPSQGLFKDRGSRFLSFAHPVKTLEEVKSLLEDHRKKYYDARHHCYAYIMGSERSVWRYNDDGEPSGTAGKPIMGQINSFGLTDILIVVTRYFGGTLLGTSGLITAYKTAAYEAITNSIIIELTVNEYYKVVFPYSLMNKVMKIIKEENLAQTKQEFGSECSLIISFRSSAHRKILNKFSTYNECILTHLETR
jgi:uncharacterized YigZ family protein